MKKISTVFIFLLFCLVGHSQNLILNPSCEEEPSNPSGVPYVIPHWIGDSLWHREIPDFANFTSAVDGNYIFACGNHPNDINDLYQDVDVSSYKTGIDNHTQVFNFSGYIRSYDQSPADAGQFKIECLDSAKTTVLSQYGSDIITEFRFWTQVRDTFKAPIHTRFIRIHMIGYRYDGPYIDAYFDDLHLETSALVLGIKNKTNTANMHIFPNPVVSTLRIDATDIISDVLLYDLNGRIVKSVNNLSNTSFNLQTDDLPNGIYILKALVKDEIIEQKIIVQH